jgi:hypothetical protein
MSIPGRNLTAATLVRTGFVVVLVLVNVSGFRPVLARGWHGVGQSAVGQSAWELDCHVSLTIAPQVSQHLSLSVDTRQAPRVTLPSGTQRARGG